MAHIGKIIQTQIYAFVPTNLSALHEDLNETWVDKMGERRNTRKRYKVSFDVKNFKYHQIPLRSSAHWISR